uniref:Uncharacterized protein n=1 Tax=Arundo donax TaxID=35708 RepID=A0A0A9E3F2_ARUDO
MADECVVHGSNSRLVLHICREGDDHSTLLNLLHDKCRIQATLATKLFASLIVDGPNGLTAQQRF